MSNVTLTEFLLAQISEDEATAKDVWTRPHYGNCEAVADDGSRHDCDCAYPTYVLAECEAKRRIMEHADTVSGMDAQIEGEWGTRGSVPWDEDEGIRLLRLLALPYANHPDYLPEWNDTPNAQP